MITIDMYKDFLLHDGRDTAEVKKNRADLITNATFTTDISKKKVYILSKDGWKFEDAKYTTHSRPSILKDAVDYYLQFRPKIHYPIGTYVLIPDDTEFDLPLSEKELQNPFSIPETQMTHLWMIVGRTKDRQFVKYSVLQCNWNFKWVYDNKVHNCWGAVRNANSYTSGKWTDEYTSQLDNLVAAWMPDIHFVYGNKLRDLNLCDNRTIFYEQRFMITTNKYQPKVYQVTKIIELTPPGIFKYSIKQDEFNSNRDNTDLMICDYNVDTGNKIPDNKEETLPSITSSIYSMYVNEYGELDYDVNSQLNTLLKKGITFYYKYSENIEDNNLKWDFNIIDNDNVLTDEKKQYYINLIKLEKLSNCCISIRPGKANSLIGKKFLLTAVDYANNQNTSIELEVIKNG